MIESVRAAVRTAVMYRANNEKIRVKTAQFDQTPIAVVVPACLTRAHESGAFLPPFLRPSHGINRSAGTLGGVGGEHDVLRGAREGPRSGPGGASGPAESLDVPV